MSSLVEFDTNCVYLLMLCSLCNNKVLRKVSVVDVAAHLLTKQD